jgi:hypothetical protein
MFDSLLSGCTHPAAVETFSFGRRPCRYEVPLLSPEAAERIPCPYRKYCEATARYLSPLTTNRVYGPRVKVGLAEPSSSIVVRSEHQYHREERRRLSLRKHLYENQTIEGYANTADRSLPCSSFRAQDDLQRYLGFVDLRLNEDFIADGVKGEQSRSNIALAVLATPQWLIAAKAQIVSGQYGPIFGGPAFNSTVYAMQDEKTAGAVCAHMCLVMGLSMLADRGAKVCGSHTLTYRSIAKMPAKDEKTKRAENKDCDIHLLDDNETYYMPRGLTPYECEAGLLGTPEHPGCVSPGLFMRQQGWAKSDRLVLRVLRANLDARFPVILFVDGYPWSENSKDWETYGKPHPDPTGTATTAHAVLAVGYLPTGPGPDQLSLVVHDPARQPYLVRSARNALQSMWNYPFYGPSGEVLRNEYLSMLAIADDAIQTHAGQCLQYLMEQDEYGRPASSSARQHFHAKRFAHYLEPEHASTRDVMIELARPDEFFQKPSISQRFARTPDTLESAKRFLKPHHRYWFIYGQSDAATHGDFWAFDAQRGGGFCYPDLHADTKCGLADSGDPTMAAAWRRLYPNRPADRQPREPHRIERQTAARPQPLIRPAAMSSSSSRPLAELFAELSIIANVQDMDLLLLRDTDIEMLARNQQRKDWKINATDLLSVQVDGPPPWKIVATWIHEQYRIAESWLVGRTVSPVKVSALATYFPDISSHNPDKRKRAIEALTQCLHIGFQLASDGIIPPDQPIVLEVVCGPVTEACTCTTCRSTPYTSICSTINDDRKLNLLLTGLQETVRKFEAEKEQAHPTQLDRQYTIALEIEPGETYFLNSFKRMKSVFDTVKTIGYKLLRDKISLNLDIAHMLIAGITAEQLRELEPWISHAHIADHPGVHTRDLSLGSFTSTYNEYSPYLPYIALLKRRAGERLARVPFSRIIAIELEGCNRMEWIHRSIPTLRQLMESS